MTWVPILSSLIAAAVAFVGVMYGARLTEHREANSWVREQRLKAYVDLLPAIEGCYEAFTLIAAAASLHGYEASTMLGDSRLRSSIEDWEKWDAEIDRCLPLVELVASDKMWPYLTYVRHGIRSRHRVLLMTLSNGNVNGEEWEWVSGKTHDDTTRARRELRQDVSRRAETPNRWKLTIQRFRRRIDGH
jgi:hypothetical protein